MVTLRQDRGLEVAGRQVSAPSILQSSQWRQQQREEEEGKGGQGVPLGSQNHKKGGQDHKEVTPLTPKKEMSRRDQPLRSQVPRIPAQGMGLTPE